MTPSDWLFNDMTDWHGYKGFNYIFYRKKKRFLREFYLFCEKCNNNCVIFL